MKAYKNNFIKDINECRRRQAQNFLIQFEYSRHRQQSDKKEINAKNHLFEINDNQMLCQNQSALKHFSIIQCDQSMINGWTEQYDVIKNNQVKQVVRSRKNSLHLTKLHKRTASNCDQNINVIPRLKQILSKLQSPQKRKNINLKKQNLMAKKLQTLQKVQQKIRKRETIEEQEKVLRNAASRMNSISTGCKTEEIFKPIRRRLKTIDVHKITAEFEGNDTDQTKLKKKISEKQYQKFKQFVETNQKKLEKQFKQAIFKKPVKKFTLAYYLKI